MKSWLVLHLLVLQLTPLRVLAADPVGKKTMERVKISVPEICKIHGGLVPGEKNQGIELKALREKLSNPKVMKELKITDQELKGLTGNSVTLLPDLIDPLFERKNFMLARELLCQFSWYLADSERKCLIQGIQERIDGKEKKALQVCDCVTSTLMGRSYCGFQ